MFHCATLLTTIVAISCKMCPPMHCQLLSAIELTLGEEYVEWEEVQTREDVELWLAQRKKVHL